MNEATDRIPKRHLPEADNALSKYTSLLHILNGEEEFILNQVGYIIGSNLEAVNVTGYEEHEIIGRHISIFYRSEEIEKAQTDLEKARRLGNTVVTGMRVKKRGVNFWAKMKIKFLVPAQPDGPRFQVILQDATHRALSKERIRTLRDEYLAIFNNPFVGTFKFRMNGYGIQMCNQKTLEILGTQNSTDLRLDHFFSSLEQFELFITSLCEEKRLEGFKFLVQDGKAPQENWAVISARYFEAQGFAEGVLFDITEQHNQMKELQRVNAELDSFIYHASHDLRSPLTSIMGLVNLGLKEGVIDEAHNYLKMIQGRIGHLDSLLKDLISVSYNNNGAEIECDSFHFKEEVDSILKLLQNPDQPFKITADISQPCDYETDPVRMRTILRNLLSNAFKYYNPEAALPSIHLNIRIGVSHCAILLKDNGIGIHQNFKNKVFDMFFRATERSAGSGLGLYIVKSMVEKLNGRISFESTLNIGTTFLLTIPNLAPPKISLKLKEPINYYMLTSKQIELVENSWDYILLNSPETGAVFYKKLFSIDPGLRQLFKGDINTQSQKLVAMITFAVHKLNNMEEVISDVKALGIHHKNNLVETEHYQTVASALLWTLEKALGQDWNEEVKDAWTAVYTALSVTMIEASK
jgi:PAS domain S-box-containing protein